MIVAHSSGVRYRLVIFELSLSTIGSIGGKWPDGGSPRLGPRL